MSSPRDRFLDASRSFLDDRSSRYEEEQAEEMARIEAEDRDEIAFRAAAAKEQALYRKTSNERALLEGDRATYAFIDRLERSTGANIIARRSGTDLVLDMLIVPRAARGRGIGTRVMRELVAHADSRGMRMRLTPASKDPRLGTTSRARLVKFYKQFGFVENKGRARDFAMGAGEMFREPRAEKGLSTASDLRPFEDPRGARGLTPAAAERLKKKGLITMERGRWVLTTEGLRAMGDAHR